MIQFNLNRFANLAKWSLAMDRRWLVKAMLSWMVVFSLTFLFFTCVAVVHKDYESMEISYTPCALMSVFSAIAVFVLGGSFMFQNFKTKHDDQRYLMLPASNLEKFLMRYSIWLLSLPCFLLAFVVGDVVQWVVNTLLAHKGTMLVMQYLANATYEVNWNSDIPRALGVSIALTFVWLHSVYVVGATFFRSHKFNWVLTSIVLIAGGIFGGTLWPNDYFALHIDEHTAIYLLYLWNGIYVLLIALNFWLSYRFFCRQQVIGKFVNV